ncbi:MULTISPECIES: N-acetylmuramoyl-L-alanine amidase [unclassified Okeania]|uniref:N-acetylmuramoyl-L-alanine amidase n=1 Tax=unclassified Okeania TaxID=2634635 RepID=UPI00257BC02F|nr:MULTISPECIES: N-acetylmuramoyl-L-alanine amidase [unclassified Okeania]
MVNFNPLLMATKKTIIPKIFSKIIGSSTLGLMIFLGVISTICPIAMSHNNRDENPLKLSEETTTKSLFIAYPSASHKTTSDRIFLIGTASPEAEVTVNGKAINERSKSGHFAPSFPLQIGKNIFTVRHQDEEKIITVTRNSNQPPLPVGIAFGQGSLTPAKDIARMPGELICFQAIAPPNANISVLLAAQTIPLLSQSQVVNLPGNLAVLTGDNQPVPSAGEYYQGCAKAEKPGDLGQPEFKLSLRGKTVTQKAPGKVTILSPTVFEVAEVTVEEGVARTGPSTTYSRLTPLPKGTKALITGKEGDYLRLDYGGWIKADETRIFTDAAPPRSVIRSAIARQVQGATEIRFPLQVPVPVTVEQGDGYLTLILHNTTAQTDTIRLDDDPLIERLDWQPILTSTVKNEQGVRYKFYLKTEQQWGYKLEYVGTTLRLTLRHPPAVKSGISSAYKPLTGMKILIDAGHGSENDLGARGPTGYPEKNVTLIVSKLLQDELIARGASVYMTRKAEEDLYPKDRVEMINQQVPDLALSVHYNALPDYGDALKTQGIGTFWYHAQAHSLAVFLHNYLVEKLDRPSYGVFWNNLALARPTIAPSVLLELGFMINPYEFEWIMNSQEQQKLAKVLADGIVEWVRRRSQESRVRS